MMPRGPSNPYHSVILWFCDSVILWFCVLSRQQTSSTSISRGIKIGDTFTIKMRKRNHRDEGRRSENTYISILICIRSAFSKMTSCLLEPQSLQTKLLQQKLNWKIAPRSHLMCSDHHQPKFNPRCQTVSRLK